MNNKRILNGLIVTIFIILGAMFVSGAGDASVSISAPDSSSYNAGSILINATFTGGNNVTNYTVTVKDNSGSVVFTNNTPGDNDSSMTIGVSWPANNGTFSDGDYTINVSILDNETENAANLYNSSSAIITVIVDNTAPNSNITILGIKNKIRNLDLTEEQIIDYGTELTINCGANDTTSGLNTTRSSISILYPGVANYNNVSSTLVTNANQTLSADLLRIDTNTLGEMRILCTLVDLAGNSLTRYYNLTTITVINQGSSAFAVEGFEAPVGKIKLSSGTVSDAGRLTTEGESRLMNAGAAIKFDLVGEEHKVEVKSASATEVTLIVTSEAQEVTITAGESESVDVNGDGIADLAITYHKLFAGNYADLTFALTSEAVEVSEDTVEEVEDTILETETEQYVEPKGGLTVTLAVIVIILIIGYALIKGKKK